MPPRFFRDPEGFEALARAVARRAASEAEATRPVRVWVLGGSIAAEAYSIGIALLEQLGSLGCERPLKLFAASDDAEVVSRARFATFDVSTLSNVSPARLLNFFERLPDGYRVSRDLRGRCVFAAHSVIEDFPFIKLDAVACPIRLDKWTKEDRRLALERFAYALEPGGLLLLGPANDLGALPRLELLKPTSRCARLFERERGVPRSRLLPPSAACYKEDR